MFFKEKGVPHAVTSRVPRLPLQVRVRRWTARGRAPRGRASLPQRGPGLRLSGQGLLCGPGHGPPSQPSNCRPSLQFWLRGRVAMHSSRKRAVSGSLPGRPDLRVPETRPLGAARGAAVTPRAPQAETLHRVWLPVCTVALLESVGWNRLRSGAVLPRGRSGEGPLRTPPPAWLRGRCRQSPGAGLGTAFARGHSCLLSPW